MNCDDVSGDNSFYIITASITASASVRSGNVVHHTSS